MLVDGQKQAIAGTTTTLLLAPGPHSIVIRAPNRKTFLHNSGLSNGESVLLRPTLYRATPLWATILTGSLTLVALGLATGFGVHALNLQTIYSDSDWPAVTDRSIYDKYIDHHSEVVKYANASTTLFVLGGVIGAASISLALTSDWSSFGRNLTTEK
jgi:hypothetical protein